MAEVSAADELLALIECMEKGDSLHVDHLGDCVRIWTHIGARGYETTTYQETAAEAVEELLR